MATQHEVQFTVPTTNTDGSPITLPLTFPVYIDTVTPPVKQYTVPSGDAAVSGVITATFTQIGFTPVNGTVYYAAAAAVDSTGASALSNIVQFTYEAPLPSAPTGFTVA
jgi:hypothetical protein